MAKFTNITQYRKVWQKRSKRISKAAERSSLKAANFQIKKARENAPRKTGKLKAGIRKRQLKSGRWVVESWVPGNFKYNMWVNGNISSVRLPTVYFANIKKWPTRDYRKNHGAERSWRYMQTNKTGRFKYWDTAVTRTAKMFPRIVKRNTRKALRITT